MKIYKGAVKYPIDEPYDGGYGLKVNVGVVLDDDSAPKAKDGLVRVRKSVVWRNPDKPELGWRSASEGGTEELTYMSSLQVGDKVGLAYQEKGAQSYYSFVIPDEWGKDFDVSKADESEFVTYVTNNQSYPANSHIYIPLSPENIAVYTSIMGDSVDMLLHGLGIVNSKIDQLGYELDAETRWKLAVTAHIDALKKFNRNLVLEADEPAF